MWKKKQHFLNFKPIFSFGAAALRNRRSTQINAEDEDTPTTTFPIRTPVTARHARFAWVVQAMHEADTKRVMGFCLCCQPPECISSGRRDSVPRTHLR
jgi:hypothetical protein